MTTTFQKLPSVSGALLSAFGQALPLAPLPIGDDAAMRYPAFPPLMRFTVRQYAAAGFGNVFSMDTRAMGGLMQLATLAFTPSCDTDVPLLLIDVMAMGKKRAVFVEYYDLTAHGASCPTLEDVAARYADLPDYPETPAWYVGERTPYALIKGGADEARLLAMLSDSVAAYAALSAARTVPHAENRAPREAFIERMVREGNPSSATMNKVLGAAGAERFFRTRVMPKDFINTPTNEKGGNTL